MSRSTWTTLTKTRESPCSLSRPSSHPLTRTPANTLRVSALYSHPALTVAPHQAIKPQPLTQVQQVKEAAQQSKRRVLRNTTRNKWKTVTDAWASLSIPEMERRCVLPVKRMILPSSSRECSRILTSQGQMHPGRSKISCQIEVFKTCKTLIWEEVTIDNSKLLSIQISRRRRMKMISLKGKVTTSNA